MNLVEAFEILLGAGENNASAWKFWKPAALFSTHDVDKAHHLVFSTPPEVAILDLTRLLLKADGMRLDKIDKLFIELALRVPAFHWPVIDEKLRSRGYYYPDRYRQWDKESISPHPSLLILAFCHPSGRVREVAVKNSDVLNPRLTTPLLLVRVNDWVGPVRNAAVAKLAAPLQSLDPADKMTLVPVVLRLRGCGRHQKTTMTETWMKILVTPFNELEWLAAWRGARGQDKKGYLEILKLSASPLGAEVRAALLRSNHRLALIWLIREVLPTLTDDEREEGFSTLRKSRVAAVKREWLTYCMESCPPQEVERILKEALLDPGRGVRQFARYYLSQSTKTDFASFYREALSRSGHEAVALEGLAEVTPDEAHREALARMDSITPSVQKAVLKSLAEASLGNHFDFLLKAVGSDVPGVPKIAKKRLFQIRRLVGIEMIMHPERWDGLAAPTQVHLIRMAPEYQKWDGLEFLLYRLQEGAFREEILNQLMEWKRNMSRSFSKLQSAKKAKLLTYVESAGLADKEAEKLRFLLARSE